MALNEQIRKAQLNKGIYYYFLPTYRQAKQVIWDSLLKEHLPLEIVEKVNDSELAVYYKNGSIQRFAGCEDIDKHRGINPIDVVFDEYSEEKEEMWTAVIQPVLRENGGTATFIFTPKGQNHSWKLLQKAKDDPNWFWSVKGVYDTEALTEEAIEDAKSNTPQALFSQEYLCEFLDNAGAFFKRITENTYEAFNDPVYGHFYKLGVDLAKYQDWTVLTPFDLSTFQVGNQERFNRTDWSFQKARIEAVASRFNNSQVEIDATGVGDPIVEDLAKTINVCENNNYKGFKFTETSRRQLLDNLAVLLEQDRIKIPNDEGLIDELRSMTFSLSEQGKLKVQVPSNMTDDRIMSLALAVWNTRVIPIEKNKEEFSVYTTQYS